MKHILSLSIILLMGCASLTPDRVAVLSAIAGQAAQLSAEAWLRDHPTHRAAFDQIITAIRNLVAKGETDPAEYVKLLDGLPPTLYLTAPSGDLMWSGSSPTGYIPARLFVWDGELQKTVPLTGAEVLPVMKAAAQGLKAGVNRKVPPMPPRGIAPKPAAGFHLIPEGK